MNFVVGKFDVIFVRGIPFLENNLSPICSGLCSDEFLSLERKRNVAYLKIANSIFRVTFHSDFLPKAVVGNDFYHNHGDKVL